MVDKLSMALERIMKEPTVIVAVEKAGMVVDYRGPEETRRMLEQEYDVVKKAAQRLGIGKK